MIQKPPSIEPPAPPPPAQPQQDSHSPRTFDYLVFGAALVILAAVLLRGAFSRDVNSGVLYFVILALACAMVFAFLPFQATFRVAWFRAGGTAAVFGFSLWMTLPYVKDQQLTASGISTARQHLEEVSTSQQKAAEALATAYSKAINAAGNIPNSPQSCAKLATESGSEIRSALSFLAAAQSTLTNVESRLTKSE